MRKRILLPLLVLFGMVLGCSSIEKFIAEKGGGDPAAPNASNSETAEERESSTGPFTPTGDPKADIEKMSEAFLDLDSFRAEMTGKGTTEMKAKMDFVAPDRFRLETSLPNGQTSEMIVVGKETYLKVGGKWQKIGVDIGTAMPNLRETYSKEGLKWFKEIKFEGEDSVEGRPAYKYTYTGNAPGGGNEYSSRMWVAKSDGLPIKVDVDYKSGDLKTMTIVYDYSEKPTIEPPIGK